ncbi:MAG: S-layer homology domain-containing protein [Clostridia bacterium]|nr:S-layer homology domain-containing protein [Clostridia bacterium]
MRSKRVTAVLLALAMLGCGSVFADETGNFDADTESVPMRDMEMQEVQEMPKNGDFGGGMKMDTVELPFDDVEEDAWYFDAVKRAYSMGIITGMTDTTFEPNSTVTGAQFVTMIYRASQSLRRGGERGEPGEMPSDMGGEPGEMQDEQGRMQDELGGMQDERAEEAATETATETESDGEWYDEAVEWATENGILLEENNGWDFEPNEELTREQMMVLIYRYCIYKGEELSEGEDLTFSDGDEISDYALSAVKSLVAEGYIEGDGDTLRPNGTLTRAEAATILMRTVEDAGQGGGPGGMGGEMPGEGGGMQGGMGGGQPGGGMGGGFGGSNEVTQGTAANEITEDTSVSGTSYESSGDDENALRITGATVTLDGITVAKTAGSSSNTENGDFYGQNAALLATDGAQVTITNSTVTSSAQNGNGVFSYGSGTVVNVSDTTITTTADNSGGIQTTGGGTMNASNLTINTSGSSAAAIRSDRGGGTVNVTGGSYTSNGYNSPAVYSTAAITVSDADLVANNSEALVIEGQNSIELIDCTVSGNMSDTKGTSSDENVHNVMIYQSMSGDAEVGTSVFSMTGGSLTGNNGDMFYVTNTHCIMTLSGVDITNLDEEGYLLRVVGNSASRGWGSAGSNGAQVELTCDAQTLDGDIIVDSISTLSLVLTNGSEIIGTINIVDNEQGGTAVDNNIVLTIDAGCTLTLTGNCTLTSIVNNGTINFNGYTITLADGTVLSE